MTKQDELNILKDAIEKLGSDSYCGQWLADNLTYIESCMRSDMVPDITIKQAKIDAQDIINCAELKAGNIVEGAESKAKMIIKEATDSRMRIYRPLYDAIHTARKALESL